MPTPTIIVVHGTGGHPRINWIPWLRQELGNHQIPVQVPQLPTPEDQSLSTWTAAFLEQVGPLSAQSILVGHSMGAGFILRLLENAGGPIVGTFLVSGWTGLLHDPYFDPLIGSFFEGEFAWEALREKAGVLRMYHGDDDPYVPLGLAKELAKNLQCNLSVIPRGKHLNAEAGYSTFPLLLSDILSLLSTLREPVVQA